MTGKYVLAIDQGTTSSRAIIFDHSGQIVATGQADVVILAREMLREPYWPLHAAGMLRTDVPWPSQYLRAKP